MGFPTSGNFLGPKIRAATPAITTSSGIPRPNRALHVILFWALSVLVLLLLRTKALPLTVVLLKDKTVVPLLDKKVDWDDWKGRKRGDLGVDRVKDDISMNLIFVYLIFGFWVFEGFADSRRR
ncbi:hypothetical protein ACFX2B_045532 [Malus domestica]